MISRDPKLSNQGEWYDFYCPNCKKYIKFLIRLQYDKWELGYRHEEFRIDCRSYLEFKWRYWLKFYGKYDENCDSLYEFQESEGKIDEGYHYISLQKTLEEWNSDNKWLCPECGSKSDSFFTFTNYHNKYNLIIK